MAYYLKADGVNDVVETNAILPINWRADDFYVEWVSKSAYSTQGTICSQNVTGGTGRLFQLFYLSGGLGFYIGGADNQTGYVAKTIDVVYRIEIKNSTRTYEIFADGVSVKTGTFTDNGFDEPTATFTLFARHSGSNSAYAFWGGMGLPYLEVGLLPGTVVANYNADLSNGTGNTLTDSVAARNGTLLNFTTVDADKWIQYASAAEPVLTNATGTKTGETTAAGSVTTDKASGTLYAVVTTSATPPSGADIKAGTGVVYATSQAVTATGVQNVSATGLSASTTYYWHFIHDNSNIITTDAFTTDAPPVVAPSTAPTGLTAAAQSDTVIRLTWNALAGATGYKIRRDGVTVTDVGNVLTFDVTGLTAVTQYGFEVLAYNTAGDGPYSAQVLETTQATPTGITLVTDFDASNVSSSLSTITDATSASPRLFIDFRPAARTATGWNIALFAVENAGGKTPVFALNRSVMFAKDQQFSALYRPSYTQDFITFVQAPARTLVGGNDGTIEFQFTDPLPSGRVYVMTNPMGQQKDAAPFAASLLANYPAVVSPTASANASGVFSTSPAEVDENGRQIGGHDMYALKFAFGGATTDGGPKRKLLMSAGLHAMGEHQSWICFKSFIYYMLNSADVDAARIRSNFDVYCYFNITPNGIFGGHRRTNFRSTTDPNRDFINKSLAEIAALTSAIVSDTGGSVDASFGWHGYALGTSNNFIVIGPSSANATRFMQLGAIVFGGAGIYEDLSAVPEAMPNWVVANLSSKFSCEAEVQTRGDTSLANYESIGVNWAKTLSAADTDGMFYTIPTANSVSIASTLPSMSSAINVQYTTLNRSVQIVSTLPRLNSAVNSTYEANTFNINVSGGLPSLSSSVGILVPSDVAMNSTLPALNSSVIVSTDSLTRNINIVGSLPSLSSGVGITYQVAERSISISSALPPLSGDLRLLNTPLDRNIGIISDLPSLNSSVVVTGENVILPINPRNLISIKIKSNFINI